MLAGMLMLVVIMNVCFACFFVLTIVPFAEHEGTSQALLDRDQTDRSGHQQDIPKPHHVQGPLRSDVSHVYMRTLK